MELTAALATLAKLINLKLNLTPAKTFTTMLYYDGLSDDAQKIYNIIPTFGIDIDLSMTRGSNRAYKGSNFFRVSYSYSDGQVIIYDVTQFTNLVFDILTNNKVHFELDKAPIWGGMVVKLSPNGLSTLLAMMAKHARLICTEESLWRIEMPNKLHMKIQSPLTAPLIFI